LRVSVAMVLVHVCLWRNCGGRVLGLERIQFKLSYNSSLLNVWTGNAAMLAGLTESAEAVIPASLGMSSTID